MTHVTRIDSPRKNPTANQAVHNADRQVVRDAAKTAAAFIEATAKDCARVIVMRGDKVLSTSDLPPYGEVNISMHDGKVRFVERVKEKVE